jgi:single-strand DNA-binding protein
MMNQCHFLGRLVADPVLKHVGSDKRVVKFRIAVDRKYKRGKETAKETAFLDMEAWDTGADLIAKHFVKGDPIIVHCSVKQEEWEDKNSGQKRSKLLFRCDKFDFLGTSSGKSGSKEPAAVEAQGGEDETQGGGDEDPIPF